MTDSPNPDRLIRAFLKEGVEELSDRVYDSVRDQLRHNRQRAVIGPWRIPIMSRNLQVAAVAAAVLAVVVVGAVLMRGPQVGPSPSASPSSGPAALPGLLTFAVYDTSTSALYIDTMNPDGSDRRTIAHEPSWIPRFSPDGTRILIGNLIGSFTPQPGDDHTAGIVQRDGSGYVALPNPEGVPGGLICTAWSPDGSRLVCGARDPGAPYGLYTIRASDGGDLQGIATANGTGLYLPGDMAADGTIWGIYLPEGETTGQIGYVTTGGSDISGEAAVADRGMAGHIEFGGDSDVSNDIPSPPRLSPDEETLVSFVDGRLFLTNVDGVSPPRPIDLPNDPDLGTPAAAYPSWSPDGEWIVFSVFYPDQSVMSDVYRVRLDGSDFTQLTDTPTIAEVNPDWGP